MMTSIIQTIFAEESIRSACLLVTMLLSGLVLFALWRGRETVGKRIIVPLYVSIPAFALSRLVAASMDSLGFGTIDFVLFSALNLIGYYCLAAALLRVASDLGVAEKSRIFPLQIATLNRQIAVFAGLGMVLHLLRSSGNTAAEFTLGLFNFAFAMATLRVLLYLLRGVFVVYGDRKFSLRGSIMLFSASWLIMELTPALSTGIAVTAIGVTNALDVAMLVIVIAGLTSKYVLTGDRMRNKASEAAFEVDAAKAELTKLSSIASNLYEDSSEMIKKQKEQAILYMKKANSLEKILQIGVNIQKRHNLDDVLKMIVEMVRDHVGFKTVTLRLFNKKAQNFEARAYVGIADDAKDGVVNYRIPITEYQKMIEPRFRISKSYFIRKANPSRGEEFSASASALVEDSWKEIDTLIVPLLNEDQVTVGYLSVENPENAALSVVDVIDTLENVATLAVIAIRNARFVKELEAKNEKLSVYAEKLSGLSQLKANFVQTVSHEFRTPLTSIKAYCETLIKNADTVDRELLKQFLFVIDEEGSRLMTLIEDILDFSQMESGGLHVERTACSVNEVVNQAATELRKNFEAKQVNLHLNVPRHDVIINGNGELIRQLAVNLLHNASKFTKEEGNVWLSVQEDPGSVRITVEDDGAGIPEGQLSRIFDQFYQVDNTSTRQHGGSGLGLAMCKSIIEWHDGRIWVENMAGSGARFVAVVPKKEVVVRTHNLETRNTVRRFEIERFLELLVENVAEFLSVGKASIMMINHEKEELHIECALGIDEDIVANASVKLGEGIAGKVAQSGKTMLVTNIEEDQRLNRSNNELMYKSKSFLCVPIELNKQVIGVVNVAKPLNKPVIEEQDARLLEALVKRFSVAIAKMSTFASASARFEKVRETFRSILDAKRYIDVRHFDLVRSLAMETVTRLGLGEGAKVRMNYLLNVYDLGLSKVGFHIIKNPKDLSPKDREEIHKHTIIGQNMLSAIDEDPELVNIVLCHHENYDGSGYPGGLKGDAIPIEARILRVADSLRALVSNRPYQRQYTVEEALDVLNHRAGAFFDPRVVEAFAEVLSEKRKESGQAETVVANSSDEGVGQDN